MKMTLAEVFFPSLIWNDLEDGGLLPSYAEVCSLWSKIKIFLSLYPFRMELHMKGYPFRNPFLSVMRPLPISSLFPISQRLVIFAGRFLVSHTKALSPSSRLFFWQVLALFPPQCRSQKFLPGPPVASNRPDSDGAEPAAGISLESPVPFLIPQAYHNRASVRKVFPPLGVHGLPSWWRRAPFFQPF